LLVGLALAQGLMAQNVELAVSRDGGQAVVDVRLAWPDTAGLLSSLKEDLLESRISFSVRLLENRRTLLPFLGDTVVKEIVLSRSAFYDFLRGVYVVENDSGEEVLCDHPEDLLDAFFSWRGIHVEIDRSLSQPSVAARVQFDPVKLMPPLTIVSLAGPTGTYTSPWVQRRLP